MKKSYETPDLIIYGDIDEITQLTGEGPGDGEIGTASAPPG